MWFKKSKPIINEIPIIKVKSSSSISFYKFSEQARTPTRNLPTDAGLDIYSCEDVFVPIGTTVKIPTHLAILVPDGFVGKLEDRSSLGAAGLKIAGGVIDSGYSGEISIIINNLSNTQHQKANFKGYQIKAGDRIAQLLLYRINTDAPEEVKELWTSKRGNSGLGSSGK